MSPTPCSATATAALLALQGGEAVEMAGQVGRDAMHEVLLSVILKSRVSLRDTGMKEPKRLDRLILVLALAYLLLMRVALVAQRSYRPGAWSSNNRADSASLFLIGQQMLERIGLGGRVLVAVIRQWQSEVPKWGARGRPAAARACLPAPGGGGAAGARNTRQAAAVASAGLSAKHTGEDRSMAVQQASLQSKRREVMLFTVMAALTLLTAIGVIFGGLVVAPVVEPLLPTPAERFVGAWLAVLSGGALTAVVILGGRALLASAGCIVRLCFGIQVAPIDDPTHCGGLLATCYSVVVGAAFGIVLGSLILPHIVLTPLGPEWMVLATDIMIGGGLVGMGSALMSVVIPVACADIRRSLRSDRSEWRGRCYFRQSEPLMFFLAAFKPALLVTLCIGVICAIGAGFIYDTLIIYEELT